MGACDQLPLDFETRSLQGRSDFIVTPVTEAAVALIDSWPDWPATAVAIYGPAGSGKSHLAAIWRERSGATNLDLTNLESTINHLQNCPAGEIHNHNMVLELVDDLAASPVRQQGVFHLLNTIREQQAYLLMISRQAPSRFDVALPDLRSRLRAIPAVEIPAPDDELLHGLLIKMFRDRQLSVSNEVIDYIVPRMERSFQGAQSLVDLLDRLALAEKRAITVPFVRSVMDL
ncbi:MAG: DnaA/Hda family protein [Alphaproteobacteria bacterium]